jgi:hypothetical protein
LTWVRDDGLSKPERFGGHRRRPRLLRAPPPSGERRPAAYWFEVLHLEPEPELDIRRVLRGATAGSVPAGLRCRLLGAAGGGAGASRYHRPRAPGVHRRPRGRPVVGPVTPRPQWLSECPICTDSNQLWSTEQCVFP